MSASVPSTSHADSRKGKPGLSCAECRRSVIISVSGLPCTHDHLRAETWQVEAQMRQVRTFQWAAAEDDSRLNLEKGPSLVSHA
jgi:hypothetical protein